MAKHMQFHERFRNMLLVTFRANNTVRAPDRRHFVISEELTGAKYRSTGVSFIRYKLTYLSERFDTWHFVDSYDRKRSCE